MNLKRLCVLGMGMERSGIRVWVFRRNLRWLDQPGLEALLAKGDAVLPLVHDAAPDEGLAWLGLSGRGPQAEAFWAGCVHALAASASAPALAFFRGGLIPALDALHAHRPVLEVAWPLEAGFTEHQEAKAVEDWCRRAGATYTCSDAATLIHPKDLSSAQMPRAKSFTPFRKQLERGVGVRLPLEHAPRGIWADPPPHMRLPLHEFAHAAKALLPHPLALWVAEPGEEAACRHLRHYMNSTAPQHYQDTRNGLLQVNQATRLSPWLAWGCLSARQVHRALVEHEERFGATQQTYWIRVELWWRDYFHHRLLIQPKTYFKHMHVSEMPFRNALQEKRFRGWCMGTEGHDFCRAHQKELLHTGYQTNRGRQNTASFLIHNLQLPAVWGALWFQHRLVDFDVSSNYGNWAYLAGSGDDPRPNRQFNLDRQQDLYDPQYTYTNRWISA